MSQHGQYTVTGIHEIRTLTGDVGGPVPGTLGNVNVLGSVNIYVTGDIPSSTMHFYVQGTNDHAVLVGNLAGGISNIPVATDGQLLTGSTGVDPVFALPLTALSTLVYTPGPGTLNIDVNLATDPEAIAGTVTNKAIVPTSLKAKLGVQTLHGLPIGTSDSVAIAWTAEPSHGQLLIGETGAAPSLATLTAGANIGVANAAHSITLKVAGTTDHCVQVGNATGDLTSLAIATNGQILVGSTTANPVFYNLGVSNGITKAEGAGTLAISGVDATETVVGVVELATDAETIAGVATVPVNTAIRPTALKAKLGVQTLHGIPIGAGDTAAIAWTAEPTTGQVLTGSTGNAPAFQALGFGSGLTAHGVLLGEGANAISATAAGATLEILTGVTGADPVWSATPTVTTLTATTLRTGDPATAASIMSLSGKTITMSGTDADIGLTITPKGTSGVTVTTGSVYATTFDTNIAAAKLQIAGTTITATGSNVDVGLTVTPKGAGALTLTTGNVVVSSGNLLLPTTSSTVGQIQINSSPVFHAYGTSNIFVGASSGNFTMTVARATQNTALGVNSLNSLAGTGVATNAYANVAIGYNALTSLTGIVTDQARYNIAVGSTCLSNLTIGTHNLCLGGQCGTAYTTSESSNILIGYGISGTIAESNVLRIGDATGTGVGQINSAFVAGISSYTTDGANTKLVSIDTATRQLGIINGALSVSHGGTGATTLTNHGVLLGSATSAISAMAVGATGQTIMGVTGADPGWTGSPSFSGSVTAGTGLTVSSLSWGAAVLNATGVMSSATPGAAGTVLTSNGATALPTFQAAPTGLFVMEAYSGTGKAMVAGTCYILSNTALITMTLPASPTVGEVFAVVCVGTTAGVKILTNATTKYIAFGSTITGGLGTAVFLASYPTGGAATSKYASVELVYAATNIFVVRNAQSTWNLRIV